MADDTDDQGADEKNFTTPAGAPDYLTNEGAGGFSQNPEQTPQDDTYTGSGAKPPGYAPPLPGAPPMPESAGASGLTPFQQSMVDHWHGKGMSAAGIAGILGGTHYESEWAGGYDAQNQQSGASGAYQYLADRADKEAAFAKARGLDPWDPTAQNEYATSEIMPGGPEWKSTGKYLWQAQDPTLAGRQWVTNFERPGSSPMAQNEVQAAGRKAAELYPQVQSYLAQKNIIPAVYTPGENGQPGKLTAARIADQTAPPAAQTAQDTSAADAAWAEYDKHMATPVGAGKFDATKLGPNVPQPTLPTTMDAAWGQYDQATKSPKARQAAGVEQQTPGWNWGGLGTALGDFVRGIPAGVTNFLGMPADMVNSANHYYAQHPQDAAMVGVMGGEGAPPPIDWSGNNSMTQYINQQAKEDPNAKAPYIPLGAQDLQKDAKYYAPWLDMSQHGTGVLSDVLSDMGQFVGAGVNPAGIGRDVASMAANPKTATALGALLHHVLMPAAASGGLDLGKWVGGEGLNSAEQHGWISQGTADAIGIASRIGLGVAGVAALHKAGEGREAVAAATSPEGQLDRAFQSSYPSTGGAAEKEAASQEIANFDQGAYPPGYQVPAGFRSSNLPLIQFAQDVTRRDAELNGRNEDNRAAILADRPEGEAQDAMTALKNSQVAQQTLIDQRLEHALVQAQQTQEIAQVGSQGALPWGGGAGASSELDLANNVRSELRMARDDSKAYTDDQWDVAREQGYTTANATLGNTYPEIEALMADNIRGGVNFPWDVVRPLYRDDPRTMFDELGTRRPDVDPGRLYTNDNTTVDQWHQVQSNIGNEIGMEQDRIGSPGSSGNPQRLRYLTQLYGIATNALEQSAANLDNPYALTRAIQASAIHHGNFVTGGIGRVLNGDDAANAANDLRTFLGNSQKATLGAQALQTAVDQRTGTAAIRAGDSNMPGQALQQNMWNGIADWMRQSYINLAANNSRGVARTWLNNMAGVFDQLKGNPIFDALHAQLTAHAASMDSTALGNLRQQAEQQSQEAIERSAAHIVLNGNGPLRLDTVFKAYPQAQTQLMTKLLQEVVQGDPSLNGLRGLQRDMWDRVMMAAEGGAIRQGGVKDWSFSRAKDFVDQSKPAFDVMRSVDPKFGARMDRLLNALVVEDRRNLPTGVQLPPGMTPPKRGPMGLAGDAATRLFQIAFSRMVAPFIEGSGMANSMQAVGQASAYARNIAHTTPQWFQRLANKVDPVSRGRQAIEDALMDQSGEKLRGLLAPVTGPSGQKWATGIEPWLKASGVMLPQGWMDQARQPGGPLSPPE